MKVLFTAAEAVPFVKTGGLGDVVGTLPKALRKMGIDARVVIPKYWDIPEHFRSKMKWKKSISLYVGWRNQFCGIEELEHEGVPFYFIDNEYYFKRQGIYGFFDEAERYAFFNRAVLEILTHIPFQPDIIHCHDWHTGMISLLRKTHFGWDRFYDNIKTIFTIHNLKYQGTFGREILGDLFGLGDEFFTIDGVAFYNDVSFIKGGLNYADYITTVSKTYAEEIKTPFYGEHLDGLMRKKSHQLKGIINGIDYIVYNPETDPHIYENYHVDSLEKKTKNKVKLQEDLGLPVREEVPMIAIISRLVSQKGMDLIAHVLEEILNTMDVQIVVLGTGEERYENMFKHFDYWFSQKLSANILFDNKLAHKMYAASDLFLMPSLFEPCGLGQMIALRYGSIPIVRETGGLKDTIRPYNEITKEGNGFSFTNYNAHEMLFTIQRAVKLYKEDRNTWDQIIKSAMAEDYSWERSAREYKELYQSLIQK